MTIRSVREEASLSKVYHQADALRQMRLIELSCFVKPGARSKQVRYHLSICRSELTYMVMSWRGESRRTYRVVIDEVDSSLTLGVSAFGRVFVRRQVRVQRSSQDIAELTPRCALQQF